MLLTVTDGVPFPGSGMFLVADPGEIFAGEGEAGFIVDEAGFLFGAEARAGAGLRTAGLLGRAVFFAAGLVFFFAALGI